MTSPYLTILQAERSMRSGGSRAMLPRNKTQGKKVADEHKANAESVEARGKEQENVGRSEKMDSKFEEDQAGLEVGERRPWLSERWEERGNGIIRPQDVDDSLRCQMSGLCEGVDSCKIGKLIQTKKHWTDLLFP